MDRQTRMAIFERQVDVYPVTCESLSAGRSNLEVLGAMIRGGAGIVQLREKKLTKRELFQMAVDFREVTAAAGVLLMINDHVDIALAVGADGVHLGQDDLPITAARRLGPDLIIGASTHSLDEALLAESQGADYVNIGPIFPTSTKEGVKDFLGPKSIAAIGSKVRIPFTVMGGICGSNIGQVIAAGARRVAMVTAITQARDISGAVREYKDMLRGNGCSR
ncbi:MAG: thiamine phosphate synthase [Syntrophobacteraceae bacterium]